MRGRLRIIIRNTIHHNFNTNHWSMTRSLNPTTPMTNTFLPGVRGTNTSTVISSRHTPVRGGATNRQQNCPRTGGSTEVSGGLSMRASTILKITVEEAVREVIWKETTPGITLLQPQPDPVREVYTNITTIHEVLGKFYI